jgi:hypothetical protein
MAKGSLFIFHWNLQEAQAYAQTLESRGWEVRIEHEDGVRGAKAILADPPDAVVFYHTRLPSHSRATADYLAQSKAASNLPVIFVGGEGESLEKTKAKLPKATYLAEDNLQAALKALIA